MRVAVQIIGKLQYIQRKKSTGKTEIMSKEDGLTGDRSEWRKTETAVLSPAERT